MSEQMWTEEETEQNDFAEAELVQRYEEASKATDGMVDHLRIALEAEHSTWLHLASAEQFLAASQEAVIWAAVTRLAHGTPDESEFLGRLAQNIQDLAAFFEWFSGQPEGELMGGLREEVLAIPPESLLDATRERWARIKENPELFDDRFVDREEAPAPMKRLSDAEKKARKKKNKAQKAARKKARRK
jgi:hypothetical protein